MGRFIADLLVYYGCVVASEAHPLPAGEAMRCSAAYEAAKVHFYAAPPAPAGSAARYRQSQDAFAAFHAWEAANPDLVAELRARAARRQPGDRA